MQSSFFTLLFIILLSTCALAQKSNKAWTEADRIRYAQRQADPTTWDTTMLREDLKWHLEPPSWPTQPAIQKIPSPVPDYDWGYCALGTLETTIGNRTVIGYNVAYAKDSFRLADFSNPEAYYQSYFTILVLTDWTQSSNRAAHIVSRNAPHYLASGKFKTSTGEVDWVQMHLADGQNFAIVSQRYFDLNQGSTLLVAQQKDGSIRFLQLKESPGAVLPGMKMPGLEDYYQILAASDPVKNFFTHPGVIGGN